MEELGQETAENKLPFNNLYLISGLVNGWNKGWMYLASVLFMILGYVFFQLLLFFPLLNRLFQNGYTRTQVEQNPNLLFDSTALHLDKNIVIALELGMFIFAFIGWLVALRFIHKKTLTSVLTGYQKFRFSRFGFAFLIWSCFLVLFIVANYFIYPEDFVISLNWQGIIISFFIMLVLMPVQTGLEELIFRGYLVQGLAQYFKNGIIPLLICSLLFGLAHMSNPEVKKFGWQIMLCYYVCFALFMGCITLLDEGLELAFGIHFANNMVSSILISTPNSVIKTYSVLEAKSENPQAEILVWFLMAGLSFLIFLKKYRWKNFNLIIR